MWSEELKKMTIGHFGDFGVAVLKTAVKGKYSYAAGFDRNLYISEEAEKLIPKTEKDKRYFLFTMDKYRKPISFIKAYDFIEDLVEDSWVID